MPSAADWYARRLNNPAPPAAPVAPRPVAPRPMSAPRPQMPVAPPPPPAVPHQATASKHAGICPSCNSGNYGSASPGKVAARCFDCGYPLEQSGSGVIASGPVTGTAVTQGNWNGFANPTKIGPR